MASEDTKDYILEFKIKNLEQQRELLKVREKTLNKAIEKQFKMLKRTMALLTVYMALIFFQLGSDLGIWGFLLS